MAILRALVAMHQLRYRVFKERLGWDVQINGDLEVDEFDSSVLHISFKSLAM
jgi:N-acyl-L-homoserine lactone synthetase